MAGAESKGVKGRGEFIQVIRSWVKWGLKARERKLDSTQRWETFMSFFSTILLGSKRICSDGVCASLMDAY